MTLTIDTSTGALPHCGNPAAVENAAARLQLQARTISAQGSAINSSWQRLSGCYVAPEGGKLRAATKPVQDRCEHLARQMLGVAKALFNYAQVVKPIKLEVDRLRQYAQGFNAWAWAHPNWESSELAHNQEIGVAPPPIPSELAADGAGTPAEWYDLILHKILEARNKLDKAHVDCAWWIEQYIDRDVLPAGRPPTYQDSHQIRELAHEAAWSDWYDGIMNPASLFLPWGTEFDAAEALRHKSLVDRIVGTAMDNLNPAPLLESLVGLRKVGWGEGLTHWEFSGHVAWEAWKGVGKIALATSGLGFVASPFVSAAGILTGHQGWVRWSNSNFKNNGKVLLGMGKNLIGWDAWKEGTPEGLTTVVTNVATLAIPGPGELMAGELAAKGSMLAERADAGTLSRMVAAALKVPKVINGGDWTAVGLARHGVHESGGLDALVARMPRVRDFLDAHGLHPGRHIATPDPAGNPDLAARRADWQRASADAAEHNRFQREAGELRSERLASRRSASGSQVDGIDRSYAHRQDDLRAEHNQQLAANEHRHQQRLAVAHQSGRTVGLPEHDAAQLKDILEHTSPSRRAAAVGDYLDGLTVAERSAFAREFPDLDRAMNRFVSEPASVTAARVAADQLARAWHSLPESVRERIIGNLTIQSGPVGQALGAPSEYWSPDSDQSQG